MRARCRRISQRCQGLLLSDGVKRTLRLRAFQCIHRIGFDLTRMRVGCCVDVSEDIRACRRIPLAKLCSTQHLGHGARMIVFPSDENHRAAMVLQRAGHSVSGRRQATFQRVVMFGGTNQQHYLWAMGSRQ